MASKLSNDLCSQGIKPIQLMGNGSWLSIGNSGAIDGNNRQSPDCRGRGKSFRGPQGLLNRELSFFHSDRACPRALNQGCSGNTTQYVVIEGPGHFVDVPSVTFPSRSTSQASSAPSQRASCLANTLANRPVDLISHRAHLSSGRVMTAAPVSRRS